MSVGVWEAGESPGTVGARIRRLRVERGLTQRDLAGAHYSRALLAAVEAGARQPSEQLLTHLAARLGVGLDELRHGRPPGAADQLTVQLGEGRRALSQGRHGEAVAVFERVRADAVRYALPELACWAGYWQGEAAVQAGELPVAEKILAQALDAAGPVPAAPRAAAVARWAYCRFAGGDTSGAVAVLEKELTGTLEADVRLRLITALIYACNELDWRERARRLEDEARELLPVAGNAEWLAQFLVTAGQLRRSPGELPEAERMFTEAGEIYRELGLKREVGLCHWGVGYVLRRAGRLDRAAEEFITACDILQAVGARQDHAGAALELAEVYRLQERLDEAERLADQAAAVCADAGHWECMAEADRLRGMVAARRAESEAALGLLSRAADRYQEMGLAAELAHTCRLLGEVLLDGDRGTEAAAVFRRGLQAAQEIR